MSETLITILSIAVIVGPIVAYVLGVRSRRKKAGVIEGTMVAAVGRQWERQRARADRFVELARRMRLVLTEELEHRDLDAYAKHRLAHLLGSYQPGYPEMSHGQTRSGFPSLREEIDKALAEDDLENQDDAGKPTL